MTRLPQNRGRRSAARVLVCGFVLSVGVGCGASRPEAAAPGINEPERSAEADTAVKLRHQIVFRTASDVQVFEGYLLKRGESFIVKAFAGPGVELFTIVRGPAGPRDTLHIPGLDEKLDPARVGDDIGRVYLSGCPRDDGKRELTCRVRGELLIETFDEEGRLTRRVYPEAHGIGLTIDYEGFAPHLGGVMAETIRLSWGKSPSEMLIRLVGAERVPAPSSQVFR